MKHFVKMKDSHSTMVLSLLLNSAEVQFKKERKISEWFWPATALTSAFCLKYYHENTTLKGTRWAGLIYLTPHNYIKKRALKNSNKTPTSLINVCIALPNKILVQDYEMLKTAWWWNLLLIRMYALWIFFFLTWGQKPDHKTWMHFGNFFLLIPLQSMYTFQQGLTWGPVTLINTK